jgi:drug/metabolite transporter, DME family
MRWTPGDRLKLILAALLFSTGGAAIKSATLSGWQVASFRSGIAALAILALSSTARRSWLRFGPGGWRAPLVGISYAMTMILFVIANKLTTSANTIFLQSTAPLYLLILGPFLLREPIRRQDVLFMLAMAAGMALFFVGVEKPVVSAPDPARGNILALTSGGFWALTVCGLRWLGSQDEQQVDDGTSSGIAAAVWGNVFAFLLCLPLALPVGTHIAATWAVVTYLGVFQIGVAYIFVTAALRRVPALEASLLLLVEPVFNPLWAWLVHGEVPRAWALAGGVLIFGAISIRAVLAARPATPEPA